MADDPYSKWLGLPDGPRPPKAHQLLGLPAKPTDAAQIDAAAGRRMDQLDQYALANDRTTRSQVQQLMNEVAKARTKLVAEVPASKPIGKPKTQTKPKSKRKAAAPTPKRAQTRTPSKPRQAATAKPIREASTASQAPELTPDTLPDSLRFVPRSKRSDRTKSAIVFWSLITTGWAASLAAVFVVTYTIAVPDTPEPTGDVMLSAVDPMGDAPVTEQDTEPRDASGETPSPDPEPAGPTQEEITAQQAERERLALERQKAEQERLALEQEKAEQQRRELEKQRLAEMRRAQAEQARQAALEKQEAERLAAKAKAKAELAAQADRGTYFERRDRLSGDAQVELIRQELAIRNGGVTVDVAAEFEGKQIIELDLRSKRDVISRQEGAALVTDLSAIKGLKLRKLNLESYHSLKTLDALEGMPLEWLNLRNCLSLKDISALKGMPIAWLMMTNAKIPDFEPLRGMPLRFFICMSAGNVTTTAPLKGIAFETISLNQCRQLKDIVGLDAIDAAEGRVEINTTAVTDLSVLRGKAIRSLRLSNCDLLKTLDGLQGATIGQLDIRAMNNLEDISALRNVTVTEKLLLERNPKLKSLADLSNLKAKTVSVECDQVANLRGLENLPNMELLDIQHMDQIPRSEVDRIKALYENLKILSPYGVLQ